MAGAQNQCSSLANFISFVHLYWVELNDLFLYSNLSLSTSLLKLLQPTELFISPKTSHKFPNTSSEDNSQVTPPNSTPCRPKPKFLPHHLPPPRHLPPSPRWTSSTSSLKNTSPRLPSSPFLVPSTTSPTRTTPPPSSDASPP